MTARCPACLSTRLVEAFPRSDVRYLRCRACRSLIDPEPASADELAEIYDGADYFVKDAGDTGVNGYTTDYLADRRFIEAKFDRVLAHLERYVAPGSLLDVGAGPGFMLSTAERRGWDARGIELNPWAVDYAREQVGVTVTQGILDEGVADASVDAVTMMDVVEHVADADDVLAHVGRVLRPGGAAAFLTPDAGATVSRLVGARWPEVRMPGEHPVLYSRKGLSIALARHGMVASGWHSIGKQSELATIVTDVSAALGPAGRTAAARFARSSVASRVVDVDPHTKMCVYARRLPTSTTPPRPRPARLPADASQIDDVDAAIVTELESLSSSERYCDWLYDSFSAFVPGARVAEIGAGIGTFTRRMLDDGAVSVLAVEPDGTCFAELAARVGDDPRVTTSRDELPGSRDMEERRGEIDLVVCQNVLEHIADDAGAVAQMASVLAPGGRVVLLVPAMQSLFGPLDDAYGHWRRYDRDRLRDLLVAADLHVDELRFMNMLGIGGWFAKNLRAGARVDTTSLRAYEEVVKFWRPIEEVIDPPRGLSLVGVGRKTSGITPG